MKAGIIAAGRGDRLARGGVLVPKPLVPIRGEPLIARVIRAAARLDVVSVACIVNDLTPAVVNYLRSVTWPVPLELVVRTTPSSMESLFGLAPILSDGPFILFTVDAVFGFETVEKFLAEARSLKRAKGVLAVTQFVDDEKPLWARLDPRRRIIALGDSARPSQYVTAGFYYLSPDIFAMMEVSRAKKLNALRQFFSLLLETGHPLYGIPVSKTVDVDYVEDIGKAEAYLLDLEEGDTA